MPKYRVFQMIVHAVEVVADTPEAACEAAADLDWEEQESYRESGHTGEFEVEEVA